MRSRSLPEVPATLPGPSRYTVLQPGTTISELRGVVAMAVMAKAPRPGKVKTRLSPPLTLEQTAALNMCFLRDTTLNIDAVLGAACVVCYTPVGDEVAFDGLLPERCRLIAQRGDGFGERLHLAATDLLSCGFSAVCLIDSDSPTLPHSALVRAVEELQKPGDRVVLGGSNDGGYYLMGLKAAHAAVFERITWSTSSVLQETVDRVHGAGLELVQLPVWYDVDDAGTLRILADELLGGTRPAFADRAGYAAEATRAFLQQLAAAGPATWAEGIAAPAVLSPS